MIGAKVIADSISPMNVRITTMQLCMPRMILSEFNTHRVFSRNASSSRAIPTAKMIEQVDKDPFIPVHFGKNQPGMSAREELTGYAYVIARDAWLEARRDAIKSARVMLDAGLHKQICSRVLEPWAWSHVIVTATEWDNFYTLRRHEDAQPEIKMLADKMAEAASKSTPTSILHGHWHLPYVQEAEKQQHWGNQSLLRKLSSARAARVSYLTHDQQIPDLIKDIELHDRLLSSSHFSPFEHQAQPGAMGQAFIRNYKGWNSYRALIGC